MNDATTSLSSFRAILSPSFAALEKFEPENVQRTKDQRRLRARREDDPAFQVETGGFVPLRRVSCAFSRKIAAIHSNDGPSCAQEPVVPILTGQNAYTDRNNMFGRKSPPIQCPLQERKQGVAHRPCDMAQTTRSVQVFGDSSK